MTSWKDQYSRAHRFLARVQNVGRDQVDYEDDLWAFFIFAWSLKDFVCADLGVTEAQLQLPKHPELMICSDLANRTKHGDNLHTDKRGARHHATNVEIVMDNGATYDYVIRTDDGKTHDALALANKVMKEWYDIITGTLNLPL